MNISAFAGRDAAAQQRLIAAAGVIAGKFNDEGVNSALAGLSGIRDRNPQYQALFQREALATFLEAVAAVEPAEPKATKKAK